ncbi:MAG: hypothetical protein WCK66_02910 [Betaproteobacteria bacterium]
MQNVLSTSRRWIQAAVCGFSFILLSACGGASSGCSLLGAALGSGVSSSCNNSDTATPAAVVLPPSSVDLSGTFGKGLLANADIQAYEVASGKLLPIGTKTKTGPDGSYVLKGLLATNNPVIVELTTTDATTMLDETLPLMNGKFQTSANAPAAGIKIRSAVLNLQNSAALSGNPFTEMAVAGALSTGALSAESLGAGKALVQQVIGIDPFGTAVVDANAAMTASQQKLMVLMAALMLDAKSNKCATDKSGIACVLSELNRQSTLARGPDNAYFLVFGTGLSDLIQTKVAALATANNLPSSPFLTIARQQIPVVQAGISAGSQGIASASVAERQKLSNFITLMRSGFNKASNLMDDRMNKFNARIDKLLMDNVGDGLGALTNALNECRFVDGALSCNDQNTIFSKTSTGYDFKYKVTSNGIQSTGTTAVYTMSGSLGSKWNSADGTGTLSINTAKTNIGDGKLLNEIAINVTTTGFTANTKLASLVLDTFSIKAYDLNSKWGQITLSGARFDANKNESSGLAKYKLAGNLVVQTSDGDKFSGNLSQLTAEEKTTNSVPGKTTEVFATSLKLSLSVVAAEGPVATMDIVASQDVGTYIPSLPSTALNPENYSVNIGIKEADQVSMAITVLKSKFDETNYQIKLTSSDGWLDLSGLSKRTQAASATESISGDVVITTSGPYSARVLTNSAGKWQGNIFNGTNIVGAIIDNILIVGGVQVSLN